MSTVYGYARVSSDAQNNDKQIEALKAYPCDEIMAETYAGVITESPAICQLKNKIIEGDTLVVESWSRLGKNDQVLKDLLGWFTCQGVAIVSLEEGGIELLADDYWTE